MKKSIVKYLGWKLMQAKSGASSSWMMMGLMAASLAVHGLVLGLPLPESAPTVTPEPPAAEAGSGPTMDVAIVPDAALGRIPPEPPLVQTDTPSIDAQVAEPKVAAERSPAVPAMTPPVAPVVPTSAASAAPPVQASPPEPLPTTPDLPPDPLTELPAEPGSGSLTAPEPPAPPTLAEQLQDPNAYQYDGRKSLDQVTATMESMNWVAEGQTLPSKVEPMELPYQLAEHCLDPAPELGLLMVVLDAEGNFLRGPEVISSTGYAVLDQQAVIWLQEGNYTLPERDAPKAYSIEVKVQYPEDCFS